MCLFIVTFIVGLGLGLHVLVGVAGRLCLLSVAPVEGARVALHGEVRAGSAATPAALGVEGQLQKRFVRRVVGVVLIIR